MDGDTFFAWLDRLSGLLLFILGLILIGLAFVTRSHEGLASIFAFTGVATAVVGLLLPRLEGQIEISLTRMAATLRAARQAGVRDDLTFEDRANEVFKVLNIAGDPEGSTPAPTERTSSSGEVEKVDTSRAPLPTPLDFLVTGDIGSMGAVAQAFEKHVERLFSQSGWQVESRGSTHDFGYDFRAVSDSETAYVSVQLRRRLSVADLDRTAATLDRVDPSGESRHVLAVNGDAFSAQGRHVLSEIQSLEVMEIPVDGW
jgi:hypothetical protein